MSLESVLADEMAARKVKTNIYLDDALIVEIDKVRHQEGDLPSRAEVIRRLLREALAARTAKAAKKKPVD